MVALVGLLFLLELLQTAGAVHLTCCQDGWVPYAGTCYYFGYGPGMTQLQALEYCEKNNSMLVEVNDAQENNFLKAYMRRLTPNDYWLALTDVAKEGDWQWASTNQIPKFTDWYPGQPESGNHHLNEDCADFIAGPVFNFKWGDHQCSRHFQPLCEKRMEDYEVIGR